MSGLGAKRYIPTGSEETSYELSSQNVAWNAPLPGNGHFFLQGTIELNLLAQLAKSIENFIRPAAPLSDKKRIVEYSFAPVPVQHGKHAHKLFPGN